MKECKEVTLIDKGIDKELIQVNKNRDFVKRIYVYKKRNLNQC